MNDKNKELLDERIAEALEALGTHSPADAEYEAVADTVVKLYKLRIEESKNDMDYAEKRDRREMEAEQFKRDLECRELERQLKREQLEEQIKEHESDSEFRCEESQFKRDQFNEQVEEHADEIAFHEREEQLKRDQMADEAFGRYIRLGAEIAGIILPLMFYGHWMRKGFEFEQTGKFTSDTFRGLFMKFRPVKK